MQVGDRVRIKPDGVSVFVVEGIDEGDRVLISPVGDSPGAYTFSMRTEDLIRE